LLETEFDIGDPLMEIRYDYKSDGDPPIINAAYFYEGDNDNIPISDEGYRTTNWASFNVEVNPENDGVRIVRRADQGFGYEKIRVYVNGIDAGIWASPHSNPYKRWRDVIFEIPRAISKGQSDLEIRLENLSDDKGFSHFRYWIYSWKKPILSRMESFFLTSPVTDMEVGEAVDLTTLGFYPSGAHKRITGWLEWVTSRNSILDIKHGRVTALAPGITSITGKWNETFTNTIYIKVVPSSDDDNDDDDDYDGGGGPFPCCKVSGGCCGCDI